MRHASWVFQALILTLTTFALSSCDKEEKPYVERPVSTLYREAYASFQKGNLKDAADSFDEVERQHPYSSWAAKAQLMSAYASYKDQKFDHAIATLDTFIILHPSHPEIAYAYYLRALCYYNDIGAVTKDQKSTELALAALEEVVKRFPDTLYGRDARFKIDFVLDHLAAKEMSIGRFYLKRSLYLAAMNRFQGVILAYPQTTQVPEALHRLVECDVALGLRPQAQKVAAILQHNFPSNPWYADSYLLLKGVDLRPDASKMDEKSWFERATMGQL